MGGRTASGPTGGLIGARITMTCARLVIKDWGEELTTILLKADHKLALFKTYVDDSRNNPEDGHEILQGKKEVQAQTPW